MVSGEEKRLAFMEMRAKLERKVEKGLIGSVRYCSIVQSATHRLPIALIDIITEALAFLCTKWTARLKQDTITNRFLR
jgi:hypothetical protein